MTEQSVEGVKILNKKGKWFNELPKFYLLYIFKEMTPAFKKYRHLLTPARREKTRFKALDLPAAGWMLVFGTGYAEGVQRKCQ